MALSSNKKRETYPFEAALWRILAERACLDSNMRSGGHVYYVSSDDTN